MNKLYEWYMVNGVFVNFIEIVFLKFELKNNFGMFFF